MSVAELSGQSERPPAFDRTPPQDVAAEQSVLGGMLLSKDAIADVVEVVRDVDFYRPAHETIYATIIDLYGRGEPADPVTVSAELQRRGDLARVGGAAYLHTLTASVPTAANAGYYADIVRERAVLRRLVEAGTRIAQMGYGGDGAIDDIVDRAQAEVYAVTEKRTAEDYAPLSEIMEGTLDEIEAIGSRGGQMVGVPTGFGDLDEITNGLHPGQMVIVAARPGAGKALALDTPLPTPDGWTTMGEVRVGDRLLGADGRPTTVVAATDVMRDRPCFEVVFSDGTAIVADAEHQWLASTRAARREAQHPEVLLGRRPARVSPAVLTTLRMSRALPEGGHRAHLAVRNAAPLQLPARTLGVDPYVLGSLLGAAACTPGHEAADPGPQQPIPSAYLRAAEHQRRALLSGLLDAAGRVTSGGSVQLRTTSAHLADAAYELVVGLGYRCTTSRRQDTLTLTFSPGEQVFRLGRKQQALKERMPRRSPATSARFVVDVRPVPSVPVRCVQVDNADHLYLAGRAMVPTHNSTIGLDLARSASIKHGMASVIFSLEMSRNEIAMRLLSAEARVSLQHMRTGHMSDDDWARIARKTGEVSSAPLFIDDSPNMSMMEIRAKCRRLKQRHDLKLVILDYLQLLSSGKRVESRQVEVSEFSRSLKLLAKELEVPVIALSQLNRGPEQRQDKKPMLSDLRESGCLTAQTRLMRADTGAEVTLGELLASGATDVPVWSFDDRLRLVPRTLTHAFPSGAKPVFRLRLASGRQITATENHPFLTYEGWRPLGELRTGDRLGVARHVPPPLQVTPMADGDVILWARLIGDRSFTRRLSEESVPAPVFALPKAQVGLFLRHLWGTDGSVRWDETTRRARIRYASSGRRLVDDIARLLLRFNVFTRITPVHRDGHGDGYHLDVDGAENQLRFLDEVGVHGARGARAAECAERLRSVAGSTDLDTIPRQVWDRVRDVLQDRGTTHRALPAAMGTRPGGGGERDHGPSRARMAKVADVLGDCDLDVLATNDVCWDTVSSIEPLGTADVYDATVLGTHNFLAEGIATHNSLEQDADLVMLLHREDMYEKESPRAGEADIILAKHRNGPTATVTVAFQGHYSRFVDMAPGG